MANKEFDPTDLSARREREEAYEPNTCTNEQKANKACENRTADVDKAMGEDADAKLEGQVDKSAVESDPTAIGADREDFEK